MVKCNQCRTMLDEPVNTPMDKRLPCPNCGSKLRLYEKDLEGKIVPRKKLQLKARHGQVGKVKPHATLQTGDSLHQDTGKWNNREKLEDKENDRYFEQIIDPETGQVIHHDEEKLSHHRGHGDAKKKKDLTVDA